MINESRVALRGRGGRYFAVIDRDDVAIVSKHPWFAHGRDRWIYARGRFDGIDTSMHRFLMCAPREYVVDHINGDTLDNRRANLRIVTQADNAKNMHADDRPAWQSPAFHTIDSYIDKTGDVQPIYYLIDKYLRDGNATRDAALVKLAQLADELPSLLAAAGVRK